MDPSLIRTRHERSQKDFPDIKFEDGEYVVKVLRRAKNSLLLSLGSVAALNIAILLIIFFLLVGEIIDGDLGLNFIFLIIVFMAAVDFVMYLIITKVEKGNKLLLTNHRLIQIMVSLPIFESVRSVNLGGVGHVEYEQNTLPERLLHFGTLKFSTHEKNIMVLENTAPKSAVKLFQDNSGNAYTFPHVSLTNQDLEEINDLITNAPKVGHKYSEDIIEFNQES